MGAQWLSGPRVRASPASLRCGPCARHIYPSLVLVQPRKIRPCKTERLLVGRKETNQTILKLYPILSRALLFHSPAITFPYPTNNLLGV